MEQRSFRRAVALLLTTLLLVGLATPAGATELLDGRLPLEPQPTDLPPLQIPDDHEPELEPVTADNWTDPVTLLGLRESDLVDVPVLDFGMLHRSEVFATGIDLLTVDDDPMPGARERHLRALQTEATLVRDVAAARTRLRELRPIVREVNSDIRHERSEERRLAQEIDVRKASIADFAIRSFIDDDDAATLLSGPAAELLENRVVVDQVREGHFVDIAIREAEIVEHERLRARLERRRERLYDQIESTERRRDLRNRQLRQTESLVDRTALGYTTLLHDRLPIEVVGTDIPLVTLNAYVIAERVLATERPSCGIQWWMLAGIGRIESSHGQFGGAELDVDGYPSDQIRGPALDGRILSGQEFIQEGVELPEPTNQTQTTQIIEVEVPPTDVPATGAAPQQPVGGPDAPPAAPAPVIKRLALISDTDGGRLDGDTVYDRAVGPMQFIPQTWRTYGVDANLDDDADPNNIYDAALSAAHYLCVAAGSMASEDGQKRGYFAYNHDDEYTESVLAASVRYRTQIDFPDHVSLLSLTSDVGVYDPPDLSEPAEPAETELGFVGSLRDLFANGQRAAAFES